MMPRDLTFRKASEADLSFLMQLRKATMLEHYERAGLGFDGAEQLQRIKDHFDAAQIIRLNGRDIGLLKIDRQKGLWRLCQIQIAPEHQRKGFGKNILRQLLADAIKEGASIHLSVLKNNPAKRLYERAGFCVIEENERAYVMTSKDAGA